VSIPIVVTASASLLISKHVVAVSLPTCTSQRFDPTAVPVHSTLPELLTEEDQALLNEFFVNELGDETAQLKEEILRQQVIEEDKATIQEL
jgi:lipase chaperone LimK